jgi:hypothetical protein
MGRPAQDESGTPTIRARVVARARATVHLWCELVDPVQALAVGACRGVGSIIPIMRAGYGRQRCGLTTLPERSSMMTSP